MDHTHFFRELNEHVEGDVYQDPMSLVLYSTDASNYQIMPLAVLVPRSAADVRYAVEAAYRHGVPVLPRGGGSSLAGQTVGAALIIDFSRHLNRIIDIDPEQRQARVEPGLVYDRLNAAAASHGLMMGPDPASGNRATLGGMLANNSTGTHSILYGNFVDHIVDASVILADGTTTVFRELDRVEWSRRATGEGLEAEIYRKMGALLASSAAVIERDTPRHWRRNSGYRLERLLDTRRNLAQLLCGSEGTLAVVSEMTVSLVPRPKRTALAVVHFSKRDAALRAVTDLLETSASAIELLDGTAIRQARRAKGFAGAVDFITGDPGAALLVEYYGATEAELRDRLDDLRSVASRHVDAYYTLELIEPDRIRRVWDVRKEVLGLVMGVRGDHKPVPFIEDASVPVEHLASYIRRLDASIAEAGARAAYYAHASAGCLHVRPFLNLKDPADVSRMERIAVASMELVREYGGVVSSEHGDGLARSWLNPTFLGDALFRVCRETKRIFDRSGILNPGKIVDAPPIGAHLRYKPGSNTAAIDSVMDFEEFGGFVGALEMCNGNGACRKLDTGTMCPSFMVTGDEQHSTRGRANALRAVISGWLPLTQLTSKRMYEVMDLCIQCKACKTECPSNVDMARIKTEWLSKYWADNTVPLRTRLFARLPDTAYRLGKSGRRAANAAATVRPLRRLAAAVLGTAPQRHQPLFANVSLVERYARRPAADRGKPIVLFPDTFTNYFEPEIGIAAIDMLEAAGYKVLVPTSRVCCGRTYLSKGFVTEVQRLAIETVDVLYPFVEKGYTIVGLEPSCILTLRDEFLALLQGEKRARKLAGAVETFEEFVARDDGRRVSKLTTGDRPTEVLVHGHCHQKALVGMEASLQCLRLAGYRNVRVVDSGCCGMAGSFGYEKEHEQLSTAMGERRLAPAVRSFDKNGIVVAAGTSCRAQIKDLTGRSAFHPAQVLRNALLDIRGRL